tara:strand:+ start:491 stop:1858 length:1368 start_codon:yes stop_codon:yes gene_type:complete
MYKTTLKDLPSVNEVLRCVNDLISLNNRYLKYLIVSEINRVRYKIKNKKVFKNRVELLEYLIDRVVLRSSSRLVNIINGTGIVLHTGFGRAPFEAKIFKNIANVANGYMNLEYDLFTGKRGDRQSHVREYISAICGSESSLVVNNNAAAVMLAINQIAEDGEVIISRGQIVEIGGSFRIPDIIEKSGAFLKEVGTTNRTNIKDYKKSINKNTKLILWVHTSNYVVKGFTESVPLDQLVQLGNEHNIPVMVDWGSGSFLNMQTLNIADEIPVNIIMKSNPDILTFSGDKLIGGPQAGIIIGKKKIVNLIQENILYRVLRIDKINLCFLEKTLRSYKSNSFTNKNLSLKLLTTSRKTLKNRAKKILEYQTNKKIKELNIKILETEVEAGSGSLPENKIESAAFAFSPRNRKVKDLATSFRCGPIPVVGYIKGNTYFIDLKAVLPNQIKRLTKAIQEV